MKTTYAVYAIYAALIVAGAVLSVSISHTRIDISKAKEASNSASDSDSFAKMADPCGVLKGKSESEYYKIYQEKYQRENHGYAHDIPLKDAVRIFNEEMICDRLVKEYSPLTEEEVIGAIVDGGDGRIDGAGRVHEKLLLKIVTDRIMPKSSLLRIGYPGDKTIGPFFSKTNIGSKGILIYLEMNLDPVHGHKGMNPNQVFLIRQYFSGFEEVN